MSFASPLAIAAVLVVAALLAALAVVFVPLGLGEAPALSALRDLAGMDAATHRLLTRDFAAGLPVFNLAVAALLSWGDGPSLLLLRLPDALAVVAACGLSALAFDCRMPRALVALVAAVSPLAWFVPIAATGLGVDMMAALLLYRALAANTSAGAGARLMAGAAIVLLTLNGVGPLAIAIVGGTLVHRLVMFGNARLLGSLRLTVLGLLVCAGLSFVGVLGWPTVKRLHLGVAGLRHVVPHFPVVLGPLAIAAVLLGGFAGFWGAPRQNGGRALGVLLVAIWVAAIASMGSTLGLIVLAPIAGVWAMSSLEAAPTRGVALIVLWGLALAALVPIFRNFNPIGFPSWSLLVALDIGVALLLLLAGLAIAVHGQWRRLGDRGVLGLILGGIGLTVLLAMLVVHPVRWLGFRTYRHDLADAMTPYATRPIVALTPVSAAYWRIALDRPLYHASRGQQLCHWLAQLPKGSRPIVMLSPQAMPSVTNFVHLHLLLQSPGTQSGSVIVAEPIGGRHCPPEKAGQSD